MTRFDDLSRSLVALDQDRTLVTVVELSASSWLAGGLVPGVERRPLKKLEPDRKALPRLLKRWREEAGERESRVSARAALSWRAAGNDPRGWGLDLGHGFDAA